MGTWDVGAFDNDAASDWAYQLEEAEDLSCVESVLDAFLQGSNSEFVDAGLACEALAACEVVARLKGNWGKRNSYTEATDRWVELHPQQPSGSLIQKAVKAIDLALAEHSELRQLWNETGDDAWVLEMADLRRRVAG